MVGKRYPERLQKDPKVKIAPKGSKWVSNGTQLGGKNSKNTLLRSDRLDLSDIFSQNFFWAVEGPKKAVFTWLRIWRACSVWCPSENGAAHCDKCLKYLPVTQIGFFSRITCFSRKRVFPKVFFPEIVFSSRTSPCFF